MDIIFIYITTSSYQEARDIAQELLEAKLIACANIVEGVESLYWWEGIIEQSKETILILKTERSLFDRIEERVKSLHSYDVPCIMLVPILQGSKDQ